MQTVLATEELIERFTLERVSRNPARFDEAKLRWLNGVYIRELPVDGADRARVLRERSPGRAEAGEARAAVAISQEKIQTLADFWPLAGFLLDGPVDDPKARERWLDERGRVALARGARGAGRARGFEPRRRRARRCERCVERRAGQAARGLSAAARGDRRHDRLARIFESVALLGREETLRRIDTALLQSAAETCLLNHSSSCR